MPDFHKKQYTAKKPVAVIVMVYGNDSKTIRMQDNLITGAIPEVRRNRNAAWPLGVATLGMFVPVLIATAILSK